jgi:hypothetical protein
VNGSDVASADEAFEAGLLDAIKVAVNDPDVFIVLGFPWPQDAADIISIGDIRSEQEPATIGRRTRNETLTAEVLVSCSQYGGQEQEAIVRSRARELLKAIEYYVRITDTTVGGSVIWCFRVASELFSNAWQDDSGALGRTCEIKATFTAFARVTS